MMMAKREPIILGIGQGRGYDCGSMSAVFKADGGETGDRYCVSEWWLEPGSTGPGAHSHEANDEIFFVIEGRPSILVGETWQHCLPGALIIIPATITHDFENRTDLRAGLLNVFIPGGFEKDMPSVVEWFRNNPSAQQRPGN